MVFRYDTAGQWFKGNTHLHSKASDGGMTFPELATIYAGGGYHFLFRTDHWVASDAAADLEPAPLLWLDGIELDGPKPDGGVFHVVCLGTTRGITRELGFEAALESARAQGALLILAHPHWSGNSFEDVLRLPFHGVEVYNHVCRFLNGKSDAGAHWSHALLSRPDILGLAVDDSHMSPWHHGWNGGWIVVNAPECSPAAILSAIRRGNFYSSRGPEFQSIVREGDEVVVTTSPVRFIRAVGPYWNGDRRGDYGNELITNARLPLVPDWAYTCIEIEDAQGRRAWTNNLFLGEAWALE